MVADTGDTDEGVTTGAAEDVRKNRLLAVVVVLVIAFGLLRWMYAFAASCGLAAWLLVRLVATSALVRAPSQR